MSDPDLHEPESDGDESPAIRQLRDALKREQDKNKELETAVAGSTVIVRENLMLKAGVDTSTPVGKFFADKYDGDLDEDSVKTAAAQVGALKPDTPTPTITPEEADQTRERQALGADASPGGVPPAEDDLEAGFAEFHARKARGQTTEKAAPAIFDRLIAAANEGDPRFRFDPQTWRAQQDAASESGIGR